MVTSSKILTVTYGTFSCTLEGFDDPFTTLQMVAEYFRKLAAEDRYFGGVPQVPDTDTLKRIAEENSPTAIDTEVGDNGIILRQTDSSADTTPDEAPLDTDDAAHEAPRIVFDSVRNDDMAEDAAPQTPPSEETATPLQSPVTFFSTRRAGREDDEAGENASDPMHAATAAAAAVAAAGQPLQAPPDKTVEETMAAIRKNVETAENDIARDAPPETAEAVETPDEDAADEGINAPHEIRAETAETPVDEAENEAANTVADEPALPQDAPLVLGTEDAVPTPEEEIADSAIEETSAGQPDVETGEAATEPAAEQETIDTATAETADAVTPDEAGVADTQIPAPEDEEIAAERKAEPDAPELSETDKTPQAEVDEDRSVSAPEGNETAEAVDDVTSDESLEIAEIAPASQQATPPEGAAQAESAAETAETDADATPEDKTWVSSLSAEEEDELARDLEAALSDDDTPPEATPDETAADAAAQAHEAETAARRQRAAALLGTAPQADADGALDRLLETTQSKMDRPEQVRRMNALEQLKAAVAATEAEAQLSRKDTLLGDTADADEEDDATDLAAYREDLRRAQNNARQPNRTPTSNAAAPHPMPSPLILVSEQRIDEPAPQPADSEVAETTVEVAQTDGNLALKQEFETLGADVEADDEIQGIPADAFADATSFSDFAERIGAFELTDLLEAAAAYTSIIEEKPRFSRAQVMSKIAKLNHGDSYSKEAGLRAFGKLLREGKILRVQDGQFGISKASRFSIASRYND